MRRIGMTEKPTTRRISRREFIHAMVAGTGAALLGACGGASAPATGNNAGATSAPAAGSSSGGKLLAWGVVSFTKAGDALLGEQMQEWGKQNNFEVEYVALPGSDYDSKLAAAVESGALPDVVMMLGTNAIFYASQNRLVDLSDVFNEVKGQAGGMYDALTPLPCRPMSRPCTRASIFVSRQLASAQRPRRWTRWTRSCAR